MAPADKRLSVSNAFRHHCLHFSHSWLHSLRTYVKYVKINVKYRFCLRSHTAQKQQLFTVDICLTSARLKVALSEPFL